jgi:hypothetical protein
LHRLAVRRGTHAGHIRSTTARGKAIGVVMELAIRPARAKRPCLYGKGCRFLEPIDPRRCTSAGDGAHTRLRVPGYRLCPPHQRRFRPTRLSHTGNLTGLTTAGPASTEASRARRPGLPGRSISVACRRIEPVAGGPLWELHQRADLLRRRHSMLRQHGHDLPVRGRQLIQRHSSADSTNLPCPLTIFTPPGRFEGLRGRSRQS